MVGSKDHVAAQITAAQAILAREAVKENADKLDAGAEDEAENQFSVLVPPRSWAGSLADFDSQIFARDAWPQAVWDHELSQPDRRYLAIPGEREAIRSLPAIAAVAGLRLAPEAELLTLAVTPAMRRRGLARTLLAQLLAWARRGGAQCVFLEVRSRDAGAQALYQRFGFSPIARRRGYYSDDDACVMRLDFSAPLFVQAPYSQDVLAEEIDLEHQ